MLQSTQNKRERKVVNVYGPGILEWTRANASIASPASPSPDTRQRAISARVTPRFLALFLVFPEPVALGRGRQLVLLSGRLRFFLVLGGRTLRIISSLRDYDAISIARIRNERYKTTFLVATTSATDAVGELDGQLLRTFVRRCLGDMNQYEDK